MWSAKRTIIFLTLVILAGGGIGFLLFWELRDRTAGIKGTLILASAVLLCVFVSMLLCALPLLISYAQTTTKERQISKLRSIENQAIAATEYYQIAVNTFKSIQPARVDDPDYRIPIISFCVVVIFGCSMVFLGGFPEAKKLFARSTFLLGGMNILTKQRSSLSVAGYFAGCRL